MTPAQRLDVQVAINEALTVTKAEQARVDAEQARVDAEQARVDAEQAEARGFQAAILALLQARAIPFPEEARARVEACAEMTTLRRWLLRAATAGSIDAVLTEREPE